MNKLIKVTSILLKNSLRPGQRNGKRSNLVIATIVLLILVFIPVMGAISEITYQLYNTLHLIQQEGIILSLGLAASAFIVFFFGIFYVLNTFYFSMDIEYFLPLPLRPSHITGAKFITTVIFEYVIELFILAPIMITFGVLSGAGPLYYLYALVIFLLLPVLPLVLASLISMVVMYFASSMVNKDKVRLFGVLASIAISVGINIAIQRINGTASPGDILNFIQEGKNSLLVLTSAIFPSTYFASASLVDSGSLAGLLNFAIFLGITALGVGFFLFAADKLYFKGAIGMSEAAPKRRSISASDFEKSTVQGSAFKAIVVKDLRILLRTPIYFINCILSNVLWPVFLAIPFITQMEGSSLDTLIQAARSINESIIFAFSILFVAFTSTSNSVAASAISREGRNIYILKYIPASYRLQILAKAFTATLVSSINLVILVLALFFIFKVSPLLLLMIILTSLICIFGLSLGSILIDLLNPKLNWDTEQKAVKQNMNVLFSSLLGMVLGGISPFVIMYFQLNLLPAFLIMTGIYSVILFVIYTIVSKAGVRLFEKLSG